MPLLHCFLEFRLLFYLYRDTHVAIDIQFSATAIVLCAYSSGLSSASLEGITLCRRTPSKHVVQ